MKIRIVILILSLITTTFCYSGTSANDDLYESFVFGNPQIENISALTFGPDGILLIGDSQKAEVVAIRTNDNLATKEIKTQRFEHVDEHLAALLGITISDFAIVDMAVNPISKSVYFGLQSNDGTPIILRMDGQSFSPINLNQISHSKIALNNAVTADAKDRRGRSLRKWAISDLQYYKGEVIVSGLSNEEFSSTLRSIPFPFSQNQSYSSIEIYHAAHGRYETYAPVKTFMPYKLNGEDFIMASFTCTPLVIFPLKELKTGQHTKGRTVAELGNRNTPLDIISYKKDDNEYLLMSNTSRALMKIDPKKVENFSDYLTTPVEESSATAGVDFLAMPYVNVLQMDKLDESTILILQRKSNGDLNLETINTGRL